MSQRKAGNAMMPDRLRSRLISRVTLPMAEPSQIERRIKTLLQTGRMRNMVSRRSLTVAALLAAGVLAPLAFLHPVAQAQSVGGTENHPANTEAAAVRLLIQMTEAYRALQAYSGTEVAEGDGALGMPYRLDLAYARPGKLAFTHTRSFGPQTITRHILLDGKTLFETSSDDAPGRYARLTTPETNYTLWQEALIIRCDVKFPVTVQLLEDDVDALFKNLDTDPHTSVRLGPPGRMDGVAVDTVILTSHGPNGDGTSVMRIGHDDHLLRQITETMGPAPNQASTTTTQTFTDVRANPALPASTFVFTPPAGAVAVDVDVGGAHADPAAVSLMAQMYAASAALQSCSFTRTTEVTGTDVASGKVYRSTTSNASIAIQKPARVAMVRQSHEGEARAIADGANLYVTTTESSGPMQALPGRYLKLSVGPDDPNRLVWLSRFGNLPQYWSDQDFMPNVILGFRTMPAESYDWKLGEPGVVDGEPVDTVTLQRGGGTSDRYDLLTLAISRRDHLLRQVSEDTREGTQPLSRQSETYTGIQKNPALPASLFVFTPPPGSIAVATTDELFGKR